MAKSLIEKIEIFDKRFMKVVFVGAPVIVRVVLGPEYEPSIMVMHILAALPLLIGSSNVLGVQIMIPFGKKKFLTSILFSVGFINTAFAMVFVPFWQETGMAVAVLLTEAFVTVSMLTYLRLRHPNPLTVRFKLTE